MNFWICKINHFTNTGIEASILKKLNILFIGWDCIDFKNFDLKNTNTIKDILLKNYQGWNKNNTNYTKEATNFKNFLINMKIGDIAFTPTGYRDDDEVFISKITSDVINVSQSGIFMEKLFISFVRKVDILSTIKLKDLPTEIKEYIKNIRSVNTCFNIRDENILDKIKCYYNDNLCKD